MVGKKERSLTVVVVIATIVVLGILIYLWSKETLSARDSILLTFSSVGISLYWGRYFSYDQALRRIEGEATKALRRIVRIKESASRLQEACVRIRSEIRDDYEGKGEQKLLLEYFQGITAQLSDLIGNVYSSIDDWGDLLPAQVGQVKKTDSELAKLVEVKRKEWNELLEEYKTKLEKAGEDKKNKLEKELDKKSREIRSDFVRELAEIRTAATFATPALEFPVSSTGLSPISFLDPGDKFEFEKTKGLSAIGNASLLNLGKSRGKKNK